MSSLLIRRAYYRTRAVYPYRQDLRGPSSKYEIFGCDWRPCKRSELSSKSITTKGEGASINTFTKAKPASSFSSYIYVQVCKPASKRCRIDDVRTLRKTLENYVVFVQTYGLLYFQMNR